MNVSITLDATIRRTRLEAGATVVRVDAIALWPERTGILDSRERNHARSPLSLLLAQTCVNEEQIKKTKIKRAAKLFFAEQLFPVFHKADHHHDRRARQADEKQNFQKLHAENCHVFILAGFCLSVF
jgi:hypothetical protein